MSRIKDDCLKVFSNVRKWSFDVEDCALYLDRISAGFLSCCIFSMNFLKHDKVYLK